MAKEDNKYRVASRYAGSDPRGNMFSGMEEEELKKNLENHNSKGMAYYDDIKNAIEDINPEMPIALIYAIIEAESNFTPNLTSDAGAKGLMQFMPSNYLEEFTTKSGKKAKGLYPHDPLNPQESIQNGVKFINDLLSGRYAPPAGDISKSLYGYNTGQNRKSLKTKTFDDLPHGGGQYASGGKTYVNKILSSYDKIIGGSIPAARLAKVALIGDSNAVRFNQSYSKINRNAKDFAVGAKGADFFLDVMEAFDEGIRDKGGKEGEVARKLLDYFGVADGDKPDPNNVVIHVTYLGGNDRTKNLKSYIKNEAKPLMELIKKYNGTYTGAAPTSPTCRLPVMVTKKDEKGKTIRIKKVRNGKVVTYDPHAGREDLNQALAKAAEEVGISFYDPIGKDRSNVPKGLKWGAEGSNCYHINSSGENIQKEIDKRFENLQPYAEIGPELPGDPDSPSRKKAKKQFQMRAKRSRFRGDYPKSLPGVDSAKNLKKSIDILVDAMANNSEFRDYIVVHVLDSLGDEITTPDFSAIENMSREKTYDLNNSVFRRFVKNLKEYKNTRNTSDLEESSLAILHRISQEYNRAIAPDVKDYFDEIAGTPYMPDIPLEENKGNKMMKITKERLAQIIKEEVEAHKVSQLNESMDADEIEESEAYIKEVADLLKMTYEQLFKGAAPAVGTPQTKADTGERVTDQTAHEDAKGILLDLLGNAIDEFQEKGSMHEDGHDDVPSAVRAMKTMAEDALEMLDALEQMDGNLPTWWTNKMAVSASMLNKMRDYLLVPSVKESSQFGDFSDLGDTNITKDEAFQAGASTCATEEEVEEIDEQ
jgi:hypothetical protein